MFAEYIVRLFKKRKVDFMLTVIGFAIVFTITLMAILAPFIAPYDPYVSVDDALLPPSNEHLMGTDNLGRDVWSRILYGSYTVMIVVLASTLISLTIGSLLGLVSGYFGGAVDRVLSLIMDSLYSFPGLIFAIAVAAMLGPGVTNTIVSISIVYIPTYFRMVRGQTLSVKTSLYVEAATAIGASHKTILFKYIFANVSVIIPVVFSMNVADAVLTEAGLSFLGLGVPAPIPDWGFDLKNGQRNFLAGYWWISAFPGFMIVLLALGFSLLGEGLNELLNPERR
ncbi:MAG: peptide ABC transporter permease [Thermofilum sp. ex4484_82]|nr:MAG: peptide ABC transporter permease [Thermofilum sp. ex4484_82]OYT39791.1 MAG: peptide ABC transporter permease [Archaeoglobales archaeon ex4484_92]RLE75035.1 MAG: ABC transporter permease [Thermoprotei archaeon]